MDYLVTIVIVGVVATMLADLWSYVRKHVLGIQPLDYGLVGRWLAGLPRGVFHHTAIADAAPVKGEQIVGWSAHYLIGISFAGVLIACWGLDWSRQPQIGPALLVGIATVSAPMLLMQPAMGAGFAASNMPRPWFARLNSLVMHSVFGLGLYAGGLVTNALYRV